MKSPVKLRIFNCKAKMSDLAFLSLNIRSSAKNRCVNLLHPNISMHILHTVLYIVLNPLTPMSDQDRISPYNINTISISQVMRIMKNISLRIF